MYIGSDPIFKKVAEDEPVFLLRAQDILAPRVVLQWTLEARTIGVSTEKIDEAQECVDAMVEWQRTHTAKVPD